MTGSRFLACGRYGGDMPLYRKLATRVHPFLISLVCGRKVTETSNGYRAMKVAVLADSRINLRQDWLHGYELEVYLIMKLIKLGYRPKEVSVSKIYPPRAAGNTKICPFVDWWNLARPIFIVGFGIEHFVNRRLRIDQRSRKTAFAHSSIPNLAKRYEIPNL